SVDGSYRGGNVQPREILQASTRTRGQKLQSAELDQAMVDGSSPQWSGLWDAMLSAVVASAVAEKVRERKSGLS
ncbi:hypothetical protein COCCADRAFT_105239, partial [Bipolaris zeicola 26-R-13]